MENTLSLNFQFARLNSGQAQAQFKHIPGDFYVDEKLPFELSGEGEHLFVQLEKTNLTTQQVCRVLAKWANIPLKKVSYSGLKDKHAVTRQWFSLYLPGKDNPVSSELSQIENISLIKLARHNKKLRTGAHKENYFRIIVRDVSELKQLESQLTNIQKQGVPNYFGEQRFGNLRANLSAAYDAFIVKKKRLKYFEKNMYLSAVRAFLFNIIVSNRIERGTWNQYLDGDVLQLDGSHSCFMPQEWDDSLQQRLEERDIHLTAPLPGSDKQWQTGTRLHEQEVLQAHPQWLDFLQQQAQVVRRSVRLYPRQLTWQQIDKNMIELSFFLNTGGYATAVLRELISVSSTQNYQQL